MKISYECSDVIEELKQDIAEFGADEPAWGVIVKRKIKKPFLDEYIDAEFLVNYLIGKKPPTAEEMEHSRAELSTLGKLLELFEEENRII